MRTINISQPALSDDEWNALREPINTGWVTQGPKVAQFEKEFASYHGAKYAVAVTSCTTGLYLALKAIGIGHGDEVIVPAFTWVASANAVLYCGAKPVLIDVDPKTFNIDTSQLPSLLTDKTKAIIPVHLFGLCADMDAICDQVSSDIFILEDAACAAGASINKKFAGTLGDAAVFSFHPRKIITTGEGGMITTNSPQLAEKLTILRNHGASISEEQRHKGPQPYILPEFNLLGYNFRMTDLQGAMGLVQLTKLKTLIAQRQHWSSYYTDQLCDIEWLRPPIVPDGYGHSWQSYVCFVDEKKAPYSRNIIMKHLQDKGISTRPGTHAVHMLSLYRDRYGYTNDDFPGSKECDQYSMAIPLHNNMTQDDYAYVVQELKGLT